MALACSLFATFAFLADLRSVPFHPDETAWINMGKDAIYYARSPQGMAFDPEQRSVEDGELGLRLLNGPVAKYLIGLAWLSRGYTVGDLPADWRWDAQWGGEYGALPAEDLLLVSRLPMAALSGLATGLVFILGFRLGGAPAGFGAALFYGLDPQVLLHGRRAMAEGPLLFSLLLSFVAIVSFDRQVRANSRSRGFGDFFGAIGIGLCIAVAISSKQTNALTFPLALGLSALAVVMGGAARRVDALARAGLVGLAIVISCGVGFAALNPVFWKDPIQTTGAMIAARDTQTRAQIEWVIADGRPQDVLTNAGARVNAAIGNVFAIPAVWDVPLYGSILQPMRDRYFAMPLTVALRSWPAVIALAGLSALGLVASLRRFLKPRMSTAVDRLLLGWFVSVIILIAVVIPLNWQRYFIGVLPLLWLYAGLGVRVAYEGLRRLPWRPV